MSALMLWRGISLGVFLIGCAVVLHREDLTYHWLFVVMAASSLVNALLKGQWRWAVHPLFWGAALAWNYLPNLERQPGRIGGWTLFLGLTGGSLILAFFVGLVPRRPPAPPPEPPRRPGEGRVIDVEAEGPS